jgi:branched-chain amino acid transport system permease protein
MAYFAHILIIIGIYIVLAVSLDLLVGQTGLLSVAHAAFYGLGAYTSALLTLRLGCSFIVSTLAGMAIASGISLIVSLPTARLHDDYFVIASFGFQMILFAALNNWMTLTRGPLGIPNIPAPVVFGFRIQSYLSFVVLAAVFAMIATLVVRQLSISPFGRVLRAIREDESFVLAIGKNPLRFKVTAFAVSAALAASAGSLYAHYVSYLAPTSFTVLESILVISMVIIGGSGSIFGPLAGATVLILLPEAFRFLGFPTDTAANLRQVVYGACLVAMMMLRPKGLIGKYGFGR